MVDGTGMCGGCRVTVDGVTRYACVDGPEFDAAHVDFAELADRLTTYREFERDALARREPCHVGLRKTSEPAPDAAAAGAAR
jgi:ferredoxin--NADP+ reductase/dihydroorotate dehydrogenase electron transfer subunit